MAKLEDFIGAAPAQHVDLGPIHHLEYLAHPVDGAAVVVLADADADKTAADQLGEEGQVAPLLQLVARQTDPLQILSETQLHVTVPIHILLLKLFIPRVKKGPLSVLGFYSMYNIWQDAGIRTRLAETAARCATNELHTSLHLICTLN